MKQNFEFFFQFLKQFSPAGGSPQFLADSREIHEGDVFVALAGEKTDGHLFVEAALSKGACVAIVRQDFHLKHERVFSVEDPLKFITELASYKLKAYNPLTIGVTGSCGKTTTKHFLEQILKQKFDVFCTPGNYNSQIGLPLAICSLRQNQKVAILEMGMSQKGDILKLRQWIDLDYAIITSIGLAHAENFSDADVGISKAKAEILFGHPIAWINENTAAYEVFKHGKNINICSTKGIYKTEQGYFFEIDQQAWGPFQTAIDVPYFLENLHLVLGLVKQLGLTKNEVQSGLNQIDLFSQRLSLIQWGDVCFLDDSYNASPSSMKGAIQYFKQKSAKRKIAVIGSMKELGHVSDEEHLKLVDLLNDGIDFIFFIGLETWPLHKILSNKSCFSTSVQELAKLLQDKIQAFDLVLIKGSHSTELYKLLDLMKEKIKV